MLRFLSGTSQRANFLFLVSFCFFLNGCVKHENLVRLQNADSQVLTAVCAPYTIHSNDYVVIDVKSLDPNSSYFYNIKSEQESDPYNESSLALNSYCVNAAGQINLPKIGFVNAKGLTVVELEKAVTDSLQKYFTLVFVKAKVVNMKFTVGGEVKQPGLKVMVRDFYTLSEALAMSGEVSDVADLSQVRVTREENGVYTSRTLDLRKSECVTDPFYIIRANDEIYVQPTRMKALEANLSPVRTALLFLTTTFAIIRLF
jgi:polysaccharide export outer membrane protein